MCLLLSILLLISLNISILLFYKNIDLKSEINTFKQKEAIQNSKTYINRSFKNEDVFKSRDL